ncbi:hypothetical protein BOX15_Mlig006578g1 [Macrostomum lignano]|uniref:Uncharacterized protein n=1 Tax=Macrostomum lignano TaxID=282301 RepID=A0A267G6K6_9PLAT|nr:hypothetical protein BOX15_Mlig006578g2 [Macrostomum lignano]PAA85223.1 hypothetical protein BOX15_Mlig006578g1 [Macrostomum lignano]
MSQLARLTTMNRNSSELDDDFIDNLISNTNQTLREGKLVRLELLSGGLGIDNEPEEEAANSAAATASKQQLKANSNAVKTNKDHDKDNKEDDDLIIDCAAHAQANVTIRESCDCVYEQQLPQHHQQPHLHQNPRYHGNDSDHLLTESAPHMSGDIGFRKLANNPNHHLKRLPTKASARCTAAVKTDAASVKSAASKAAAIAAIKAASSKPTDLADDFI